MVLNFVTGRMRHLPSPRHIDQAVVDYINALRYYTRLEIDAGVTRLGQPHVIQSGGHRLTTVQILPRNQSSLFSLISLQRICSRPRPQRE